MLIRALYIYPCESLCSTLDIRLNSPNALASRGSAVSKPALIFSVACSASPRSLCHGTIAFQAQIRAEHEERLGIADFGHDQVYRTRCDGGGARGQPPAGAPDLPSVDRDARSDVGVSEIIAHALEQLTSPVPSAQKRRQPYARRGDQLGMRHPHREDRRRYDRANRPPSGLERAPRAHVR
jgi:hypothetical protein